MYYLNAFNEMQRKRRQNMMGGGQDQGVGTTAPSGPMGLGPAQDRNAFRDTLNSMSPLARTAMGMMPVIGPAFNVGRLVDAGISAYQGAQLAPSRDARERAQDQFRASEISEMNAPADAAMAAARQGFQASEKSGYGAPEYGPAPTGTIDPGAYEGGFIGFGPDAVNMGGGAGAPYYGGTPAVSSQVASPSISSESLGVADNSYGGFGDDTGGSDTMGFAGTYAHGGMVDARHLKGRAPAPDDGYGALQGGEYVITKAAVEKYGKRLLDAINNGTFR
jgi:hypothetical protein